VLSVVLTRFRGERSGERKFSGIGRSGCAAGGGVLEDG
jgi:hypothetical protein